MIKSVRNITITGIKKAILLSLKFAPEKRAIAPTAVKLNGCGISRVIAERTIKTIPAVNCGEIFLV